MRNFAESKTLLRSTCLLLALSLGFSACGRSVPIAAVKGTVTYKGAPLPGGSVLLLSETGFGAGAEIQRDGTFFFVTQHGKGLPLGDYHVAVWCPWPGDVDLGAQGMRELMEVVKGIRLPRKFQDPATSGLTTTVLEGTNELNLELK